GSEEDPRGQEAPGVERVLYGTHAGESPVAEELPQDLLLELGSSDAVLRQRSSPERRGGPRDAGLDLLRGADLARRPADRVRMEVAVRDVPPPRVIEPAPGESSIARLDDLR